MDLAKVFQGLGTRMLTDFEHIQSQIKHHGERGGEREAALREFLRQYLPSCYAVSKGEVVDIEGQTSHQCDLVIYDSAKCPLLLAGEDYQVFPVEPVVAVVEVKSVLTKAKLEDAVDKIACVKRLKREQGPVTGVIFAYKSAYKRDIMRKTMSDLQQVNVSVGPCEYADILCILESGTIELRSDSWPRITDDPSDGRVYHVWVELTPGILLWFFINLLDLVNAQQPVMPKYAKHAQILEIGVVFQAEPCRKESE